MGSVGHGVQWDTITEYHVVPVHREFCEYTIIPSSPCPTEYRVPLNPHIPLCHLSYSTRVQFIKTLVLLSKKHASDDMDWYRSRLVLVTGMASGDILSWDLDRRVCLKAGGRRRNQAC